MVPIGTKVRKRVKQSLACLRALMVNELIKLNCHAKVVQKERIFVKVLEETKLALFNGKFTLVFKVSLRVDHPLSLVFFAVRQHTHHQSPLG